MRVAAIGDAWRRLRRGDRHLSRLRVSWRDVARLSDGHVVLTGPITLFCGENGAGKTSILEVTYLALTAGGAAAEHGDYCRLRGAQLVDVEIDVWNNDRSELLHINGEEAKTHFLGGADGAFLTIVDSGMHVPAMITYVRAEPNFSDLLEGVAPRFFTGEELSDVSFIVGRDYSKVQVWEVEDSSFGPLFPYFVAESHGVRYGSESMGYGELAAFYFVWLLSRLSKASLLLIEEPEAFLSPRSQIALVDVLAARLGQKQATLMMTSHSGAIATRLEPEEIAYVTRSAGDVRYDSPPRRSDLIDRLGLIPGRPAIFFVEDRVSKIFARVLLDHHSRLLTGLGEFVIKDGDGGVRSALVALPSNIRSVAHIGILDGDLRGSATGDSRLLFLPGSVAPEAILIEFARSKTVATLADVLGSTPMDVDRAFAHAGGRDPHDWVIEFSRELRQSEEDVLRRLAFAWADDNAAEARSFVASVEALVRA